MSKKLILLIGAPGSGKTTDGKTIAQNHAEITHYCTSELLMLEIEKETKIGKICKSFIDQGALVPTDIVIDTIVSAIKSAPTEKVLLGGFPRKEKQMKMFADALFNIQGIELDSVIEIRVSEAVAKARVFGEKASDEAFDTEMKIYQSTIAEIEAFYTQDNLLQVIDGEQSVEVVLQALDALLQA